MDAALVCAICGFQVSAPDGFPAAQLEMDAHYAATGHGATQAATALDAARAAAMAAAKCEYNRRVDVWLGGPEAAESVDAGARARDMPPSYSAALLYDARTRELTQAEETILATFRGAWAGIEALKASLSSMEGWVAASDDVVALSALAASPGTPPAGAPGWSL